MTHQGARAAIALALVCGIVALPIAATSQNARASGRTTFTSPNGDFQLRYPSFLIDCNAQPHNPSCSGYMPDCSAANGDAVVCLAYPRTNISELEQKTFDGAAFVVTAVKEAHDEKACRETMDSPPPDWKQPRTRTINGVEFWASEEDGAAMSHGEQQMIYRAFHNHHCYELDANISGVSPMVYDPPPKAFDDVPVRKALEQTLESFRFLK